MHMTAIAVLLLFGRSCVIVGHHRLTDELFPAAAIFRAHCDVVNCVHCLMLSMYCFRGLPRLRLPSTYYSCTTVFVNTYLAAVISAKVSKV